MAENIIDNKQGSTAIPAGLPEGSVAIPHPDVIKDFDVTGTSDDNTTLFGIPKITSDNLTPEDPIDLTAGFRENIDTTASDVAGAKPIVSELDKRIAELTATPTETQTKFDETLSQFTDLLGETEGRSQAQLEAEQAQNIPQLTQDLSTVRGQILTKSAEFDALEQSLESKSMSTASLIGQQAVIRRAKASELNLLYAKSQALQGQVSSAQATVDRAINLKYETINTRLNIFERQLDAIQPQLNKEETIRAEAQRQLLEEEKQKVTDDKARDKQIQNIALEAIRAGLGNEISEQISNSKSLEEANQIAANAGVFETAPDLQFISGTARQQAGTFNKATGQFTPLRGGGGVGTGGTGGTGTVVAGDTITTSEGEVVIDDEIAGFVELVRTGKMTTGQALDDVTKGKKADLASALSKVQTAGDTATDAVAKEKAQLALDLQTHKGLNSSVGPFPGTRIGLLDKLTGKKQDFIAGVERLVSGLSLESLIEAKSRGATFGALSDTEMSILTNAATKIGTWRRYKDDDIAKPVTHYAIDEKSFKNELDNINKIITRTIKSSLTEDTNLDPLGLGIQNTTSDNPLGL